MTLRRTFTGLKAKQALRNARCTRWIARYGLGGRRSVLQVVRWWQAAAASPWDATRVGQWYTLQHIPTNCLQAVQHAGVSCRLCARRMGQLVEVHQSMWRWHTTTREARGACGT